MRTRVLWWCGRLLFCASLGLVVLFLSNVSLGVGVASRLTQQTEQNLGVCASRCSVQPLSLIRHGPRPIPSFRRDNPHHTQSSHILCCCPAQRSEVAGCPASRRITHAYFIAATMPAVVTPFSSKTWSPGAERPNESTPSTLSAYLYHAEVTPASTARVIALFGSTSAW